MSLPLVIYYCCVAVCGAMMAILGFDITTPPFWIGLVVIIVAYICGKESVWKEVKS